MLHIAPPTPPTPEERVAAVMFRLSGPEGSALAAAMGEGWAVRDARQVEDPDAVLLRPCSSQTVGAVRRRYPEARIIVLDTPIGGADRGQGPIQRALEAGADLYLSQASAQAA